MVKLIVFDLDGTMLDSKKQISQRNMLALWKAHEAGIHIVPATGRLHMETPEEIRKLPLVRYIIAINGALIYDFQESLSLYQAEITLAEAEEIFDCLDTLPVIYDCYQANKGWMPETFYQKIDEYISNVQIQKLAKKVHIPLKHFREELRERGKDFQKIQMFFRDQDLDRREKTILDLKERFPNILVTSSLGNNIELNAKMANKGTALCILAEKLGIDASECMAFGDGTNDILMLEKAGTGVAMKNAAPQVLEMADRITESNDEDGVAIIIEEILRTQQ